MSFAAVFFKKYKGDGMMSSYHLAFSPSEYDATSSASLPYL